MSGDGSYVPHEGPEAGPDIFLEPGHGGGCVTSGPFKEYVFATIYKDYTDIKQLPSQSWTHRDHP